MKKPVQKPLVIAVWVGSDTQGFWRSTNKRYDHDEYGIGVCHAEKMSARTGHKHKLVSDTHGLPETKE